MSTGDDNTSWVTTRVADAREALSDDIPTSVVKLLQEKLGGDLQQRSLRPPELKQLAEDLIDALDPPNSEQGPQQ